MVNGYIFFIRYCGYRNGDFYTKEPFKHIHSWLTTITNKIMLFQKKHKTLKSKWYDDSWCRSTFMSKLTPCNLLGASAPTVQRTVHSTRVVTTARAHLFCHSLSTLGTHLWPPCLSGGQSPVTADTGQWPRQPGWARHNINPRLRPLLLYAIIASLTNYMGTGHQQYLVREQSTKHF